MVVHQSCLETRHLKLSRTDGCSETIESVRREHYTDDTNKSPQKIGELITTIHNSDTISSGCKDVPEGMSRNVEDKNCESSAVLQQMRQVGDDAHLLACNSNFCYNQPQLTQHAITGVF